MAHSLMLGCWLSHAPDAAWYLSPRAASRPPSLPGCRDIASGHAAPSDSARRRQPSFSFGAGPGAGARWRRARQRRAPPVGLPQVCHRCATRVPRVGHRPLPKAPSYKPCLTERSDLSKVELFRRSNTHVPCDKGVPDLSKVELFPRRNNVVFWGP